jgi:hypothetical protein
MSRLTKLEREMLARAAEFAMAGEWPWEGDGGAKDIRTYEREHAALTSARNKLTESKIDTSDIPESTETFFKKAKLRKPD